MKNHLIPYTAINLEVFYTGINLYNHGPGPATFELVMYRHPDGFKVKTITEEIPAWHHRLLLPDELSKGSRDCAGRVSIEIQCPDDVHITAQMGNKHGGFGFLDVKEVANLKK